MIDILITFTAPILENLFGTGYGQCFELLFQRGLQPHLFLLNIIKQLSPVDLGLEIEKSRDEQKIIAQNEMTRFRDETKSHGHKRQPSEQNEKKISRNGYGSNKVKCSLLR